MTVDALRCGMIGVIEWLIASGRDIGDVTTTPRENYNCESSPLSIAKFHEGREVANLLERFLNNPEQTRHDIRVNLKMVNELAASVFALTIFVCENLLQIKSICATNPYYSATVRFFTLVKRLPMELQMILCNFAVGSTKGCILTKDSEPAFKALAKTLVLLCD